MASTLWSWSSFSSLTRRPFWPELISARKRSLRLRPATCGVPPVAGPRSKGVKFQKINWDKYWRRERGKKIWMHYNSRTISNCGGNLKEKCMLLGGKFEMNYRKISSLTMMELKVMSLATQRGQRRRLRDVPTSDSVSAGKLRRTRRCSCCRWLAAAERRWKIRKDFFLTILMTAEGLWKNVVIDSILN